VADGSSDSVRPDTDGGGAGATSRGARKVALVALGCRVSRADLDALAAALPDGFGVARAGERADYVVVNTCTVTADADRVARQTLRRAAREHPGARIVAAGCYAALSPGVLEALPGVEAVIGARDGAAVVDVLARLEAGERGRAAVERAVRAAPAWAPAPVELAHHTRPFLKLQDGCDASCSYCVVPLARGPSRSLPWADALARLAALGARHPEVVVTGVHLGAYGRELRPARSLADLLRAAVAGGLAARVRLSSIEPRELPLELLRDPAVAPALCEHFHLPLQSGSASVLAAMRRPYAPDAFRRAVDALVAAVPGACVGTDVLVGFPGETDADHAATVTLVEALPLAYLHVFPFSPRPGTPAAAMPGAVPRAVQQERARELRAISDRRWRAFLAGLAGRTLEVVVERIEDGVARGTSREFATVRWPAGAACRGDLVRVRVDATDGAGCAGVAAGAVRARSVP
jgi:threonylcarbamoyladenosine tRNA methylthiotransferase MtaB